MSVMASAMRYGEAFTREDLEHTPDDGHRYELVDGTLIVGAAPGRVHQRAAVASARVLDEKGRYREVAKATGEERFEAAIPFPVTVVAADLVRR